MKNISLQDKVVADRSESRCEQNNNSAGEGGRSRCLLQETVVLCSLCVRFGFGKGAFSRSNGKGKEDYKDNVSASVIRCFIRITVILEPAGCVARNGNKRKRHSSYGTRTT